MQKKLALEVSEARFRVNTVARRLGVHTSTIKRLEARGLFNPVRDRVGHRRYSESDLTRLREILFGPGVGR